MIINPLNQEYEKELTPSLTASRRCHLTRNLLSFNNAYDRTMCHVALGKKVGSRDGLELKGPTAVPNSQWNNVAQGEMW